jgi:hypothetical protein
MAKRTRQDTGRTRKSRKTSGRIRPRKRRGDELPASSPIPRPETGARLSAGDVDADWARGESSGEETVGGSVATPDQDVVDEIGRALGVEQDPEAEVTTSDEILRRRDRFRWHLERDAEAREREAEERADTEASGENQDLH